MQPEWLTYVMVLIEDRIDEDSPPKPDDISVTSAADAFGSGEAADDKECICGTTS